MYNYLIGRIVERNENSIVFECNNIGYDVFVSSYTLEDTKNVTEEIKLLTYYQVKEDGVCLFGFLEKQEKDLFLKLIDVSGVGPKGAIGILSSCKPDDLIKIIAKQDLVSMSKIKGVGKKTAERILVELKDKVDVLPIDLIGEEEKPVDNNEIDDACAVLVSLGISKQTAYTLCEKVYTANDTAEDIIAKALKEHNGR